MKDDRNGNNGRESRRPWVQRNAVWIGIISTWLMVLSGVGIKTWAQSESTTLMAMETKGTVALNTGIIGETRIELATIKSDVGYIKEELSDVKDEMKIGRTLLNEIYRLVKLT